MKGYLWLGKARDAELCGALGVMTRRGQISPNALVVRMITTISCVVTAFFYRKANIIRKCSNILQRSYGGRRPVLCLQISLIWMETCIASCGLWAVEILKYLRLLRLSAEFSWLFAFFFDWQLAPAGLLSDLFNIDANWRRLDLLTDSRRTSQETKTQIWNWIRHLPHHKNGGVNRVYTAYKGYTAGCSWCVNNGRTAASSAAISSRHHPQEMLPTRFSKNCPIKKASTFRYRHRRLVLLQTQNYQRMHISFEYTLKMGTEGRFCAA